MKKVHLLALMAAAALLNACADAGTIPAMKPLSESQKALIADDKNAFCIVDTAGLWSLQDGRLSRQAGVDLGDRLQLLERSSRAVFSGRTREIRLVRSSGGQEGWMRVDQIAPSSILSAVTANAIPVYSQMRLSALTRRKIPFMTVVAISTDSAAADFLTISCFDEEAETLLSGVIIRNMGISSAVGDVESAILYRVAMRTPNPVTKRALLSSALADYPGSAFTEAIQNALQAPPPEDSGG